MPVPHFPATHVPVAHGKRVHGTSVLHCAPSHPGVHAHAYTAAEAVLAPAHEHVPPFAHQLVGHVHENL